MPQLYTEHILKLPDGINILYTDSGAPNTPDYTTIVVLHGTGFNGCAFCAIVVEDCTSYSSSDSFVRLHEYAHKYNLRIVICNRRDYRGSTKYSDDELADLQAGRQSFQHLLGLQTAWFLEHFIKHENTPKVTADGRAGGFILVGWSFGNATTLALLAEADMIPQQLYKTLEPHLRSLVLYGSEFVLLLIVK
jgi:pimeloyl-ACP methyl ester carboxylesterase